MKSKLDLLAAGMLLATMVAGFGQSTLQFSATTYSVPEWAGTVTLTVQRTNDLSTEVSVDYATADGTATNGLKYTATNGTLAFAAGETNQSIVVPILDEGFVEGTKTFTVTLSNPTNAVLGARTNANVSILDIDLGAQFQFASYNSANGWAWAEDVGTVLIAVVRGDDASIPASVACGTSDVTAPNGVDYIGFTNTLLFAPTERLKFVPVTILNDGLKETANKTFRATLSNPVGVSLGATKTTTITIMDNDQGFQFERRQSISTRKSRASFFRITTGPGVSSSSTWTNFTAWPQPSWRKRFWPGTRSTKFLALKPPRPKPRRKFWPKREGFYNQGPKWSRSTRGKRALVS